MKKDPNAIILDKLRDEYPDAGTMLNFSSLFELLIAVVLSAQSTDEQVNRATARLFKQFNTADKLAALELTELEDMIKGVGIFRNKAKHIKQLASIIQDKYQGEVPADFDKLLELPGVGRKTANVIMAVGFKQPGLGVDTHVQRVANRLGLVQTKTPEQTEYSLKQLIPKKHWSEAHHLLIFHGRRICKARKPDCHNCVLQKQCARNFAK
ncbi:MAG: endonuclease III [Syntrophomonadaceae bacterium]|nr:endonuclease III [Syntrophomonadaceae bacterium]MDD3023527.1 endonuclease III [Syntrophomonadaceae bacterium]